MPSFTGGNLGLTWGFVPHENGWYDSYNLDFQLLDATVQLAVIKILSTPPGSPTAEDRYIVGPTATGAWSGHENAIAVWTKKEDPDTRAWVFFVPIEGWRAWNADTQSFFLFDGTDWVENGGLRLLRAFGFGSDPTSLLTADQAVLYIKLPFDFTIPADFGDFQGAGTAVGGTANATANVVLRLQHAAAASPLTFTDVGTITIGIGTTVVSDLDSSAADIVGARNDVLRILAPTTPDATFKGVFGSLVGYES